MHNQKHKKLFTLFLLADVILIAAYVYLAYIVKTKNEAAAALYGASHQAASDAERIKELEQVLNETEADRKELSSYFVTKTNEVTFIEQIENIGKSSGVALSVNTVADNTDKGGGIELSFAAAGTFADMYRLMALVEALPYKVVLEKVNIKKSTDVQQRAKGGWEGTFAVALESITVANTDTSDNLSVRTNEQ